MAPPQRLSALETTFLELENRSVQFVVGSVLHFDRPLELDAVRDYVEAALDEVPRYRQRIGRVPILRRPIWVDDEHFDISQHLCPVVVPAPGGPHELEVLVGRLLEVGVPDDHPPWRLWIVHGLAGGRGALVGLFHHALIDGISGMRLLERILRLAPDRRIPTRRVTPVERHGRLAMLAAELRHRAAGARALVSNRPGRTTLAALRELIGEGLHAATDLGLNPRRNSPVHSVASYTTELAAIKAIGHAAGAKVNDVVLAIITEALRRWFAERGEDPDRARGVRAMLPVARHDPTEHAASGNRVALLLAPLPIELADPAAQLARIVAATRELKHGESAAAGDLLVEVSDLTSPRVLETVLRIVLWRRAFNVIVTNVPGPPVPLYLLDAKLEHLVPIINLWPRQALGIALASYAGTLHWGLHADAAVLPDLAPLVAELDAAFTRFAGAPAQVRTAPHG